VTGRTELNVISNRTITTSRHATYIFALLNVAHTAQKLVEQISNSSWKDSLLNERRASNEARKLRDV
jgi:hypothetical protein